MPRLIELMRDSAVPSNIMRSAALGSLSLPAAEMIEILVFLTSNPVFGKQARLTLAGWDEAASIAVAADPKTPRAVLDYMLAPQNRRPKLIPALLENPGVEEASLLELAQVDSREVIAMMLASARVRQNSNVVAALLGSPHLSAGEAQQIQQRLAELGAAPVSDDVLGVGPTPYEIEHAAEIAAEEGRRYELVELTKEESTELARVLDSAAEKAEAPSERLTLLQRIARLTVGERVQLAMKGSRDERFILIRDGSKVVSSAVVQSPKVNVQEIEAFASMKNVQESVLRGIAQKRKFMKNYAIVRALVNNPRCPLDISVALIKNLLIMDLKNLSLNKNVPDTIRKLAVKLHREKAGDGKN